MEMNDRNDIKYCKYVILTIKIYKIRLILLI